MRRCVVACLIGLVLLGAAGAAPAQSPAPPFAFKGATFDAQQGTIQVRLQAVADAGIRVAAHRHGHRLGRRRGTVSRGTTLVTIHVRRSMLRGLRAGAHVTLVIEYGGPHPLRIPRVVLEAADAPPDPWVA